VPPKDVRRVVLIDTDTASDDAVALMMDIAVPVGPCGCNYGRCRKCLG